MARLLGIDYGSKRVGVALSDESGSMAFPLVVIENKRDLLSRVMDIVEEKEVEEIVLGESKKLSGEDNVIMKDIHEFKKRLEEALSVSVYLEPEFYTSIEATRHQEDDDMSDARAAAIILQSYIDKRQW